MRFLLRTWICCVLLISTTHTTQLQAQPPILPVDDVITIPLEITPKPVPVLLSKYYFQIDYSEMQPGDKLSGFLKCFCEQQNFFSGEQSKQREEALKLPLDELKGGYGVEDGIAYKSDYVRLMGMIDQAARYNRNEWNEYFNIRKDSLNFLLPEVQSLRSLMQCLALRLRLEIKKQQFEKAIVTVRTLIGLARFLETHPTLIGNLVGMAGMNIALGGIQEMMTQPNCPNLYWSFAELPNPVFSFRNGFQGERMWSLETMSGITIDKALTEEEVLSKLRIFDPIGINTKEASINYGLLAISKKLVAGIRERLIQEGCDEKIVNQMSNMQIVVLEDFHRYKLTRDQISRSMNLPFHIAIEDVTKQQKLLAGDKKNGWMLSGALLPAVNKIFALSGSAQQKVALLMTIEAVRLHAHENKNQLPMKLSDCKLYIPNDPVTNKPFDYVVENGVAKLNGAKLSQILPKTNYEIKVKN